MPCENIKIVGPYPICEDSKQVSDGPYKGELLSVCNEYSGTMRVAGIRFSPKEAKEIRDRFNISKSDFHLDSHAQRAGTYCITYKNPAMNRMFVEELDCSDLGEGMLDQAIGKLPFSEKSRCRRMKESIEFFVPREEPGALAKLWDGLWIGGGFAGSAMGLNWLAGKLTGKSILDRIKNGKGPKGPAGGAPAGGAPEGSIPSDPGSDAAWRSMLPTPKAIPAPKPEDAAELGTLALIGAVLVSLADKALAFSTGMFIMVDATALNQDIYPYGRNPDTI